MHHALIKEIKKVVRLGTCRAMLPDIYRSGHVVVSREVFERAREWKRELGARIAVPPSAIPPFKMMTLTVGQEVSSAAYWVLQEKGGAFSVIAFSSGYLVKIGAFLPGSNEVRIETGSPVGWLNATLSGASDEEKLMAVTTVAFIIATLNTPGMVRGTTVHPDQSGRSRVRKLLGKAALAWTSVDIVPGAVRDGMRNPNKDGGKMIALHRRRGNFAWVPSQRETPKAVWLSSLEAPRRGAGWYVWREERLVGSETVGVKAQRHVARMPGEKRPEMLAALSGADAIFHRAALGAVQRAMMARRSSMPSVALH